MKNLVLKLVKTEVELQQCLNIRQEVFIKEQQVPKNLEIDKYDNLNNLAVKHFILYLNKIPIGTLRVINTEEYLKIGRVAVLKVYRKENNGYILVSEVINKILQENIFEISEKYFYLEAQVQVIRFYEKLGFESFG
ncbi:MAG: GNAT family N-acetyltransferase, partial [Mycoplasmatales bacterium]